MMHCAKRDDRAPAPPSLDLEARAATRTSPSPRDHRDLALLRERGRARPSAAPTTLFFQSRSLPASIFGAPNAMPCARHRLRLLDDPRRVQQRLRRNAADVEAHAAERRPALDQRDLQAEIGRAERGRVAAGPGAEHDEVEVVRPMRTLRALTAAGSRAGARRHARRSPPRRQHGCDRHGVDVGLAAERLGGAQRRGGRRWSSAGAAPASVRIARARARPCRPSCTATLATTPAAASTARPSSPCRSRA